jgi:hypothetical protein
MPLMGDHGHLSRGNGAEKFNQRFDAGTGAQRGSAGIADSLIAAR